MTTPIDKIGQVITDAIIKALEDRQDELTKIAEAGGNKASGSLLNDVSSLVSLIKDLFPLLGEVAGVAFPPLGVLEEVEKSGGKYGLAMAVGYWLGGTLEQAAQPIFLPMNHAIADQVQTEIFDPQTAAQLQAKGIIGEDYGRSEAAGGNLDGPHYDKLVDAALQRPQFATLLDLWNRGYIKETDVDLALQRNGIPPFWVGPLKQLRYNLLSPADLALANLRGELSDADMLAYGQTIGANTEDMTLLVANTGEPPAAEMMMEAYRRGFVDQSTFDRAIRQSRIRNEWIPTMLQLRYSPMSVADAIRAVIENYLTDEQGKAIAEQNGLLPEHWEPMKESWGRPLSHLEMMALYYRGAATVDDVKQAMRESDLKDKYINQAIELGRRLVPERQIVTMLERGVITHPVAHQMLRELGFNDTDAERMIALGAAQHTAHAKELSRTDIVNMYVDSLLTEQNAEKHLVNLGFTSTDAEAILQLAKIKQAGAQLKAIQRGVEAEFRAGNLTERQAVSELEKAHMEPVAAQRMVALWKQEKRSVLRSLTEAQILSLAEHQLISADDARARLVAYGLPQGDADLLLALHGIVKAP